MNGIRGNSFNLRAWLMTIGLLAPGIFYVAKSDAEPNDMLRDFLRAEMVKAFENRTAELEGLAGEDALRARQEKLKAFFVERIGGWPEKTPLNAEVVDRIERDGYRVEKILYESRPKFYVTALLFLPKTAGPHPGVLVPCGHEATGKASEAYQRACILLALNGIAALCYDPIGQGERNQILDESGKPKHNSTIEHTLVTTACIPLGWNAASYRIWDGIRGIDYLCGRGDIDPKRIGCTGNSGGGTLTSYIMALDERVACAAPSCYICSLKDLILIDGPHDGEQNIYGQIAFGMDHGDYLMMRGPRPTLICCATRDFFPIQATWNTFRDAKRFYTKLGFPERVAIVEADEQHGFTKPLRQAMAAWMKRWLLGVDEPVTEPDFAVLTEAEARVTPQGQVLLLEGARSVFDINAEFERKLAAEREAFWKSASPEEAREKIREITGIRPASELPVPEIQRGAEKTKSNEVTIEHVVLRPEEGIMIPAELYTPDQPTGVRVLYVDGRGRTAAVEACRRLAAEGAAVFAPDLRGMGETQSNWTHGADWDKAFGPGYKATMLAYLLERPLASMRAEDVLICARFLSEQSGETSSSAITLIAAGDAIVPALHAAALEPGWFAEVELADAPPSWSEIAKSNNLAGRLPSVIHGALRHYDWPDLARLTGRGATTGH